MQLKKIILCVVAGAFLFAGFCGSSARAQDIQPAASSNFNVLALTPAHSATITYELSNVLWNNFSAFHMTYIFTTGAGTITVRTASATAVGEYSNIIYASFGLLGVRPVFGYAYTANTISLSAEVGEAGFGVLFTSIVAGIGDPSFPVVMGTIVSLN
jgi:hypothetical protein